MGTKPNCKTKGKNGIRSLPFFFLFKYEIQPNGNYCLLILFLCFSFLKIPVISIGKKKNNISRSRENVKMVSKETTLISVRERAIEAEDAVKSQGRFKGGNEGETFCWSHYYLRLIIPPEWFSDFSRVNRVIDLIFDVFFCCVRDRHRHFSWKNGENAKERERDRHSGGKKKLFPTEKLP